MLHQTGTHLATSLGLCDPSKYLGLCLPGEEQTAPCHSSSHRDVDGQVWGHPGIRAPTKGRMGEQDLRAKPDQEARKWMWEQGLEETQIKKPDDQPEDGVQEQAGGTGEAVLGQVESLPLLVQGFIWGEADGHLALASYSGDRVGRGLGPAGSFKPA